MEKGGSRNFDRGIAYIELLIVLSVLVLIIVVTIDVCRLMNVIQISATVSRESAALAYRECSGDSGEKLQVCLNSVRDFMQTVVNSVKPNSEVVVSLYQYDTTTSSVIENRISTIPVGNHPSKFSLSGSNVTGLSNSILSSQRLVAIGEVHVPYTPITWIASSIISIAGNKYYDATVL